MRKYINTDKTKNIHIYKIQLNVLEFYLNLHTCNRCELT